MRSIIVIAAGLGVSIAGSAAAQTAKNTPEGIICAVTGSCDAATNGSGRVPVGNEKAFSLARPTGPAATTQPMRTMPTRAMPMTPAPRAYVATRPTRRPMTPGRIQPGGGLDMLVNFKVGSAQLTPQAEAEARAFAQAMAAPQLAGLRFAIEGHTDASGGRAKNLALSEARARSVVDYLVAQGVDGSRLVAKGYGPDRPLPGKSASAPANRRVEFVKLP